MRIIDERKPTTFNFSEVRIGEVFFTADAVEYGENPYMRISEIRDMDEEYFNVVDLIAGELVYFNSDEPIIKCNAVLKIY